MAESSSDFTESSTETKPAVLEGGYTPTEEERRVFKQCDSESFWYRSVPLSVSGMGLTHFLVTKGKLSASGRFGSLPKVLFAGMCGYFAGKFSYMKTCQQKFYNLENSPIAEALRQRHRHHHHHQQRPSQFAAPHSELSEDEEKSRIDVFQSENVSKPSYSPSDYSDITHSSSSKPLDLHTHALRDDDDDEKVKRKPILYEELRNKNRENYDITRSQKLDRDAPKMDVKKNKYGDTWDD